MKNQKSEKTGRIPTLISKFLAARQKAIDYIDKVPFVFVTVLAFALEIIIEFLTRRNFVETVKFIFTTPWFFLMNTVLLFFMFSLSYLFTKRYTLVTFFALLWLGFAVADSIMMSYRVTPLTMQDILLLPSVITIIDVYLNWFEIIFFLLLIIALLVFIVFMAIKQKSRKQLWLKSGLTSFVSGVLSVSIMLFSMNSDTVEKNFSFIGNGYGEYGFVYSFLLSAIDRGIDKPSDYDEDKIDKIKEEVSEEKCTDFKGDVNIIMLQLESFVDVNNYKDVVFSENPIPFYTYLKENYPSASVFVPAFGAGTANTEFEVITQMATDFFGIGETPYSTVIRNTACETVCYDLKDYGYATHAIHNHQGTFYHRNIVYPNLGFDTFTSVEYMQNVETTPQGWAKDNVLTNEILSCLESTDEKDYIYCISVQGHGKYPDECEYEKHITLVSGMEEKSFAFEYYVNQLYEMDLFLKELTETLSNYSEKVLLVLYGDHYPAFEVSTEGLFEGDEFSTDYIIWSNYGFETDAKNVEAYRLSSYILKKLNFDNGTLTKFHNKNYGTENYLDELALIQYDMLYGEKYISDGENTYTPTEMKMGHLDIVLESTEIINDVVFVKGRNFTSSSKVFVNNEKVTAYYINETTLILIRESLPQKCESIFVAQVAPDSEILSTTNAIAFTNE